MEFVNLTPHSITIINEEGSVTVPPSGSVARVSTSQRRLESVGGVDLYTQEVGEVHGLPDSVEGTLYIVSTLVRTAIPERHDLASPGELIRDEDGRPVGCKGLVINR